MVPLPDVAQHGNEDENDAKRNEQLEQEFSRLAWQLRLLVTFPVEEPIGSVAGVRGRENMRLPEESSCHLKASGASRVIHAHFSEVDLQFSLLLTRYNLRIGDCVAEPLVV